MTKKEGNFLNYASENAPSSLYEELPETAVSGKNAKIKINVSTRPIPPATSKEKCPPQENDNSVGPISSLRNSYSQRTIFEAFELVNDKIPSPIVNKKIQ